MSKEFLQLPRGLTNFGNNCYINVIFQVRIKNIKKCISSFEEFDNFSNKIITLIKNSKPDLTDKKHELSLSLLEDFNNTIVDINSIEDSYISHAKTIENINENFSFAYEQQVIFLIKIFY